MRHVLVLGTALLILAGANQGWADNPVDVKPHEGDPATEAKVTSDDAKGSSPDSSGERWRFKRHQGLWWYWLPTNKWVYWTGDRWVAYDAKTYAEFMRLAQSAADLLESRQIVLGRIAIERLGSGTLQPIWAAAVSLFAALQRYSATRSSAGNGRCAFLAGLGG